MTYNRYACLQDLNNYFSKKDLLGGLTDLEQQQLRKNIGITDSGEESKPLEITHSDIFQHIVNKTLITGKRYKITDFKTIYSSNTYNEDGNRITWGDEINPSKVN